MTTPKPDPHTNVVAALAWVTAQIGGIAKTKGSESGGFYAYRGIDAIAAQAQPLLGAAGVVIVPTTNIVAVTEIQVNGRPWTDTTVTVDWTIYGPCDTQIEARTQGVGRDNTDHGFNKAATQAFKNLLLRILCIGDPKDDTDQGDGQHNYTDARPEPDSPERTAAIVQFQRLAKLTGAQREALKTARAARGGTDPGLTVNALTDDGWRETVTAMIDTACEADAPNVTDPADL